MKPCVPGNISFGGAVSLISRSKSVYFNDRLGPLGLSAGQVPVLMLLAREQNLMQEDLVRHYRLDKGTIARAVKKLDDRGFIRRITDPKNRRAVRLFLTERGEDAIPLLHSITREWESRVSAGFSPEESMMVLDLLHRMAWNSFTILEKGGGAGS